MNESIPDRALPELPGLIAALRRYPALPEPTALPVGDFEARLLGPAWFRHFARLGLAVGGLPRWHGKRFRADGSGVNLLRPASDGAPQVERLAMQLRLDRCRLDGRGVVRVGYDAAAVFPWPAVVDELRPWPAAGHEVWLGMARTDWRWSRGLSALRLPFALVRDERHC
ncbi:MAG: hypothetical protein C0434_00025 [Xanthomonadaceae bacterium]|nr:hypothetical protein [Xanthomonadaceae bacterium]